LLSRGQLVGGIVGVGGDNCARSEILLQFQDVACQVVGVAEGTSVAVSGGSEAIEGIVGVVNGDRFALLEQQAVTVELQTATATE